MKKYEPDISNPEDIKTVDMEKRIKFLIDIKQLFDRNNIEFFPLYGTLLGFIRERGIMSWDVDVDLGAWYYDYDKIIDLKEEIERLGYKILIKSYYISICFAEDYGNENAHKRFCHIYNADGDFYCGTHFHIGIGFFVKDKDSAVQIKFFDGNLFFRFFRDFDDNIIYRFFAPFYRGLVLFVNKLYVLPYMWVKNLDTIMVYDLDFKVLSDCEQYLFMTYGNDWRVPVKSWSREKYLEFNKLLFRYKIRDKKVKDLWIKRDDIKD